MSVRLFVGNLAFGVTETEVRDLFSAAGAVTQVRLPNDRETGKPRGFAFVDFEDRAHAEEAIRRFNQYMFKDRALAVNEARAREASAPGAGPRAPSRPASSSTPNRQPTWTGLPPVPSDDDAEISIQPRRNFGPDAAARDRRKQQVRTAKKERGPKGPLREIGGGQRFFSTELDDDDDDQGVDDFALWAREDEKSRDKE